MNLPNKGALYGERYRVIVSTDIGGPNKKWGLNAYEYIVREFGKIEKIKGRD